jgi:hypothetical protein
MVELFLPLSFGKRKETKKIYKKGDIKNYKFIRKEIYKIDTMDTIDKLIN